MMFWILAAGMTFAACMAVILPFWRRPAEAENSSAHDLQVYADQFREVERDLSRGLIGRDEAEEARAELGRRVLRVADGNRPSPGNGSARTRVVATAALLLVPILGWGTYAMIGSPGLPGQPLQARLDKDPRESTLPELVSRAERHLAQNPDDARGWAVVAPIYLRTGRAAEAVTAYRNAIRLGGPAAELEAGLGEALTEAAGGTITADAVAAFNRALELDARNAKARFFIAGSQAQEGRVDEAKATLTELLGSLDEGSAWRAPVQQALAGLGEPGPSGEDIAAASDLSPEERAAMVEGMVGRLAQRLADNPYDTEGWIRLVRSYQVLGRPDEARAALKQGLAALETRSDEAGRLQANAAAIGVTVTE